MKNTFADYKKDGAKWITLATGEYYPDILPSARELYKPVLVIFGQLLKSSESSERLPRQIGETPDGWMRVQLNRVFRKYVSPSTPVEMLKVKSKTEYIIAEFGREFRQFKRYKPHLIAAQYLTRLYVLFFGNIKIEVKRVTT